MKKALKLVKQSLPPFNKDLIIGFRKRQMESPIEMVDTTWKNVVERLERPDLSYEGYRILNPVERAEYELNNGYGKNNMSMLKNEVILVAFRFIEARIQHEIMLYLPYEYGYAFVINGVKNFLEYTIFEKVFFKINDGINLKVRLPINFRGHKTTRIFTSIEKYKVFDTIVNVKIHNRSPAKVAKTTLLHYILAYYGFEETIKLFGFTNDDIFVADKPVYGDGLANFCITSKKSVDQQTFLIVKTGLVETNYIYKRIVSALLHVFSLAEINYNSQIIYQESIPLFRLMLGTIIYDKRNTELTLIKSHIDNHLSSLVTYIDSLAVEKLKDLNIKTIWEFLVYVFVNYEHITNNVRNNDLFSKRIEIIESMMEELIIRQIYNSMYSMLGKSNVERSILKIKISPTSIFKVKKIDNKKASSFTYGSSLLIPLVRVIESTTGGKTKSGSGVEDTRNHFDTSFALVKNANFQSSSDPGKNALLNLFLKVDERGAVIRPDEELIQSLEKIK